MAKTPARRKRGDESNKGIVIKVRVTEAQKHALQDAAERNGLELSTWLRHIGLRDAGAIPKAK